MPNSVIKKFKKYKNGKTLNGINLESVYLLELEVYRRLSGYKNFPSLIDVDDEKFRLTLEWCGESLSDLRKKQIESLTLYLDLEYQITHIVSCLEKHNIQYVDISLQNICFKEGTIYLIDFDSVILDNASLSSEREEFLNKFNSNGKYEGLKINILQIINRNFNIFYEE